MALLPFPFSLEINKWELHALSRREVGGNLEVDRERGMTNHKTTSSG